MDLFPPSADQNLLPYDGTVQLLGTLLPPVDADAVFRSLLVEVPWQRDEVVMFGKKVSTSRRVAWYGDSGCAYTYSGTTKKALPWNGNLLMIKERVEQLCHASFNSCLLNLYADGREGMGWHSDDEKSLGINPVIASVSLGAERRFCFKHKATGEKVETWLQHGSLLVMKGSTQHHWLHGLPKALKVTDSRINLTFRTIREA